MRLRGGIVALAVAVVLALALGVFAGSRWLEGTGASDSSSTERQVRFTAAGDFADGAGAVEVLDGIAASDSDLTLALGDLSYGETGKERAWCTFVTRHVGEGYPFQLLAGNHESNGQNGNINDFSACLPNQLPGLVGAYGRQWYADVPAEDPLVRFVMISPDLDFPNGTYNYDAGTRRYRWTQEAIDGGREAGIPWTVVGIHKPCLSVGRYECDIGTDLVNMLMAKQVDLVLMGHEHNYQRTHQLDLRPGCPTLTIDGFDADCVADDDAEMTAGEGTVFTVIGTGGAVERDTFPEDPEADYFAATAGAASDPEFGFGDFTVTPTALSMEFEGMNSDFTDGFTLTKTDRAARVTPKASFTSSAQGLTASFDGSGSSDSDGVLTTYDWDFGDGRGGGGETPQHEYTVAGTYSVILTVTDDSGASSSSTRQVTVRKESETTFAADAFERTLNDGWGSADQGGSWTTGPTADAFSVGDGVGRIRLATAGARPASAASLETVRTKDLTLTAQLALSALPSKGRLDQTFTLRRRSGDTYRAIVRVDGTGSVRVGLAKSVEGRQVSLDAGRVAGVRYASDARLLVRAQAVGVSPTALALKVWKAGRPEPKTWQVTAEDRAARLQGAGYVGLSSYLSSDSTVAPVVVEVDNLRVSRADRSR